MLKSMTGFGSGRAAVGAEDMTVELRSVNHKFCEVKARLPRELAALEPLITKTIKDRLARGAVDVTIKRSARTTSAGLVPTVDVALAREYRRAFAELSTALGVPDTTTVKDIISQQNVVRLEEPNTNVDDATKAVEAALGEALGAMTAMREKEGAALRADLTARLGLIATWAAEIQALAPQSIDQWRERLTARVEELSKGMPIEPQRLAQEVALFAERTDVAEELTRLDSHLSQFTTLIASTEPSGRKMDFLVQEMHREVNTTGSKSQHAEISVRVMQLKTELERIREQVQNVE